MTWTRLLFAHWPVAPDLLRPHIPPQLALETRDGAAWLGVVPFGMSGVRPRCGVPLPWVSRFLELNLRTYVTAGGKPGVWFFSLDAGNPLAVRAARRWFHLPYYDAQLSSTLMDDELCFTSFRTHRGAPAVRFAAVYAPTDEVTPGRPGTIEHWLTERYCLYAADPQGQVWRGEIDHRPWPLQRARVAIECNTMAQPLGLALDEAPAWAHYAERLDVLAWPLELLAADET